MPVANSAPIPKISKPLIGGFLWFVKRYVRKHFHVFAVNNEHLQGMQLTGADALVVYANHPSWWDPISALILAHETFPEHRVYAPIDAQALAKYRMFAQMGFYGVDQSTLRGASDFLRQSTAILEQTQASIWLTPEGRFVDPREPSTPLAGGLAHLASKLAVNAANYRAARDSGQLVSTSTGDSPPPPLRRTWFVPGAVEYVFWEERKPEVLCWFGRPLCVVDPAHEQPAPELPEARDKTAWNQLLTARLREAQAELSAASIARDSAAFKVLIGGQSGSFFVYDWWRSVTARLRGESLNTDHSDKLQSR